MRAPIALLATFALACSVDGPSGAVGPERGGGKADAIDRVDDRGALASATAAVGQFTEDLAFDGYRLAVRDGARVRLEITRLGTAKTLDTTLFVYGPAHAGAFGEAAIAFDDDSGWGRQSRLTGVVLEAGEYLVVVGTHDARGRGAYRLLATCENGECDPLPAATCDGTVANNILACMSIATTEDPQLAPADALAGCTSDESLGAVFDRLCDTPQPMAFCPAGIEPFVQQMGPACHDELAPFAVRCVFGDEFRDLQTSGDVVAGTRRVLSSAAGLTAIEQAQLVATLHAVGFPDVTTAAEALDEADGGEVNRVEMWDRTSARPFVAYELGAGDTSVGAYFPLDTDEVVAVISDGFLGRCTVDVGPQGGDCTATADCSVGVCIGSSEASDIGRCTVLSGFGPQTSCSADTPCDIAQGLLCAGLTRGDDGQCFPAWMRSNFGETDLALGIPDADATGISRTIMVHGLASVDMDVELAMRIEHSNPDQLRVTLTNPAGTEVVISDGPTDLFSFDRAVLGFSGDEGINGPWTLRIVDHQTGSVGSLDHWTLRLGSRFD
ncbi:MAG: proprotein convertase P-domain-containing protein [Nannocystaceae bacterium]